MNTETIRLLFQVRNRRGLGHLMRALNIVREISSLAPNAAISIYVRTAPPPDLGLGGAGIRYIVEQDHEHFSCWPQTLESFSPHVVIYDTLLPQRPSLELFGSSTKCVYIMRRCREDEQQAVFQHPFLDRVDAILIPHTPAQFGYEIPDPFASRTTYVGPILRVPNEHIQNHLRSYYQIEPGDFVLTSTVGGGGFESQADAFFTCIFDVHRRLLGRIPRLKHLVVQGPNFTKQLAPLPGMTLMTVEPELVNLLAISDVAIAEGGYNTVGEIQLTGTPAIFLPSARGKDDQIHRVDSIVQAGLGYAFSPSSAEAVAEKILALSRTPSALTAIRTRYAAEPIEIGNRHAAQRILELA